MIISRTPLRISLGGGGTDLPSYYEMNGGGFLVAAAITKHIYITIHENFEDKYLLKYSQIESVDALSKIQHPLFREVLKLLRVPNNVEISSQADIPAGTGLGSSGAFTVGLLKAVHAHKNLEVANLELAKVASEIEISTLKNPIGKQDQYIAAFGGLSSFEYNSDGSVIATRLDVQSSTMHNLESNLILFFTGIKRSASQELAALENHERKLSQETVENLNRVKECGLRAADMLTSGDLHSFAKMLTEQWNLKLSRSLSPVNLQVDNWIRQGINAGAEGGKLVGAGGGGFLLFYSEEKTGLRKKMSELGLKEIKFGFDFTGSAILK